MNIQQSWQRATAKINHDVIEACIMFGASITSGYRTKMHNAKLGGESTSFHLDGLAYDVTLDNPLNAAEFRKWLTDKGYRVLNTGKEPNPFSFHIQYAWPYITRFDRVDHLSHMKAIADNFNFQFEG